MADNPVAGMLNARAGRVADRVTERAEVLRAAVVDRSGGRVIDCGAKAPGGIAAGVELARVCLADLAEVSIVPGEISGWPCARVQVLTDHPVAACLASQYAGWQISLGKFFAMGSGPMRAASAKEPIFERIRWTERPERVVGVLECRKAPGDEVVAYVAETCGVDPARVTLLFAPTASLAGTVQIVARSVETALHKLAELGFDLNRIESTTGDAPLPPVARDDLQAIGRTNDAILYGARVALHVRGDDESLEEIGPRVPSSSSADHGLPFAEIFARYNHDFYAVDPHLFSPAEVMLHNLDTGRTHRFGRAEPAVLYRSFFEN